MKLRKQRWLLLPFTAVFSIKLSWVHVIASIVSCIILLLSPAVSEIMNSGNAGMPRRYYDYGNAGWGVLNGWQLSMAIAVLLFLAGQLAYIVNLLIGLFRRFTGAGKAKFNS